MCHGDADTPVQAFSLRADGPMGGKKDHVHIDRTKQLLY